MEEVFCTKRTTEAETPHSGGKRDCLFTVYCVCRSKCAQVCHCVCSRRGTTTRRGVSWQASLPPRVNWGKTSSGDAGGLKSKAIR